MAITYPRAFPNIGIDQSTIEIIFVNRSFEANKQFLIDSNSYSMWRGSWTTSKLSPSDVANVSAWLLSMQGMGKTFKAYDPDHTTPYGGASGSGLVNGGSQTGDSINTDGWPISTLLFNTGDYIQINDDFHIVIAPCTSDGSGDATIDIAPPVITAHANNSPILYNNPFMIARLSGPVVTWDSDENKLASITMEWEQVK